MARKSADGIPAPLRKYARRQPWVRALFMYLQQVRIDSKEVESIDDERGGSELNIWDSQLRFLLMLCEGLDDDIHEFFVLKSRQLGLTTIGLVIITFWVAVHSRVIGCIVADTNETAKGFRDTITRILSSLPDDFVGDTFKVKSNNNNMIVFSNESRIDFIVAGKHKKNWGESKAYSVGWISEVSKFGQREGIDSFIETMSQTLSSRLFIWESTANGFANNWKDLWNSAGEDVYRKRRCFIGWWAKPTNRIAPKDPAYAVYGRNGPNGEEAELIQQVAEQYGHIVTMEQLAWYRQRQADKSADESALDQNQPWTEHQAFVQSGYSFFQMRLLSKKLEYLEQNDQPFRGYRFLLGTTIFDTRMEEIHDQADIDEVELRLWEDPIPEGQYVVGCDPAYGNSEWKDRHAIQIWRCYADKLIQVAEYVDDRVETHHCAWVLAYLAGAYRNCIVNLEINGPGQAIMREFDNVKELMRTEMYARKVHDLDWEDFLDMARWYLYHRPDSMGTGYVLNFESHHKSKMTMLNQYRDLFTSDVLFARSKPLLIEMANVTQDKDDIAPKAGGRLKDDRVIAAALAAKAYIDWIRGPLIQEGATYDVVTAGEMGELSVTQQMVKRIVFDFWRNAEERAQAPETPTWLRDRGFV